MGSFCFNLSKRPSKYFSSHQSMGPISGRFLVLLMVVSGQHQAKEKAAIEKQIDAMIQSRNNHNYTDLETYTTEDTDWVNM